MSPKNLRRFVRWGAANTLVVLVSLILAWLVRAVTAHLSILDALPFAALAVALFLAVNHAFGLYHRIWRYASGGETLVIAGAVVTSTILLLADALDLSINKFVVFGYDAPAETKQEGERYASQSSTSMPVFKLPTTWESS